MGPTQIMRQPPKAKTRLIHEHPVKTEKASPIGRQLIINHPTRRFKFSRTTTPKYSYWKLYPKTVARPKPRVQPSSSTQQALPDTTGPGFGSVEDKQPAKIIKIEQNPDVPCGSKSLLLLRQPEDNIPEETHQSEDNKDDQGLSEDHGVLMPTKPYLPKRLPCVLNGDYYGKPAPLDEIGIYADGGYSTVHAANKRLRVGVTLAMRLRPFQSNNNEPDEPSA